MNGVRFGAYHSYDDLQLILTSKTIGQAAAKEKKVNIEGGNGVLDFTEYFGETKFKNRTHKFNFSSNLPQNQLLEHYSAIQNTLHGKTMKIILDEDPNYYYMGRLSVSDWQKAKTIGTVTVVADCEPYKYKLENTVVTKTVSGTTSITLLNMRKRVVPEITTDAEMTIVFNGVSTTASAGTFQIPTLELSEGANTVTVTGTGTITFTYREGCL